MTRSLDLPQPESQKPLERYTVCVNGVPAAELLFSLARDSHARGAGRALLAAAERAAVQRGCVALRLEVRETNLRAIEIYERAGYRRIGREENYYEDGAPALRFEKMFAKAR